MYQFGRLNVSRCHLWVVNTSNLNVTRPLMDDRACRFAAKVVIFENCCISQHFTSSPGRRKTYFALASLTHTATARDELNLWMACFLSARFTVKAQRFIAGQDTGVDICPRAGPWVPNTGCVRAELH
jgi:hypothetical protein